MRILSALMVAGAMSLAASANAAPIVQWTFDTGNPGPTTTWGTDYAVSPPASIIDPGVYALTNTTSIHPAWTVFGPEGGDQMMACNGGTKLTQEMVWTNTVAVNLTPGIYQFSFWSANEYPTAPTPLQVNINGSDVGAPFTAAGLGVWQFNSVPFFVTVTGDYTFALNNFDIQYTGNDFAIDEIQVNGQVPEPTSLGLLATAGMLLMKRRTR